MHTIVIILYILAFSFVVYAILPNIVTRWFRWFCLTHGPVDKNQIALTFDDGPDPQFTGRILDVLQVHQIRATFFVLATKALSHPDLIERMIHEGHEVAVHGMTHRMVPLSSVRQTIQASKEAAEMLSHRFGITPRYYRPTWGLCNLSTFFALRNTSLRLVTWSVMVGDWRVTEAHTLLKRIMKSLHPGGIIVLHDSDVTPGAERGAPEEVIRLLPLLVKSVQSRGLHFVPMSHWIGDDASWQAL
jgi:peptidoglycan-N-acetylglucosamine deacetylase